MERKELELEFKVLCRDVNLHKVYMYNIFNNIHVYEETVKEVKKYMRNQSKYEYRKYYDDTVYHGKEAFVRQLDSIIKWQEWSRVEYEISVGDPFEQDCNNLEKIDCYYQAHANIEIIADYVIAQYKKWNKENK